MSPSTGLPRLLSVGYANVDLIARLPDALRTGGRVTVRRIQTAPGGMAANTACVAASLGSPVTLFAATGDDAFRSFLLDAWTACGVDVSKVLATDERPTTKCLVTVEPDGERTIISEQMSFDYGPLVESLTTDRFPDAAIVFFDGYRISDFGRVVDLARSRNLEVAVDLDGCEDPRALEASLPRVDMVLGNRAALARLVGSGDPAQALSRLAARGPGVAVCTGGRDGAWVMSGGSAVHVPGHDVEVVDTIGAGDAFDGAFLHAYSLSRDPAWSARYANAAAAISTSGAGALGRLPTDAEVRRLLA